MKRPENNVRVYDNNKYTFDRYTVLIFRQENKQRVADVYSMSDNAKSPQGFNQFSHTIAPYKRIGSYVPEWGKRIALKDLPQETWEAVMQRI